MNAVMRWRYQHMLQPSKTRNELGMREKGIGSVNDKHGDDHVGMKTDKWQNAPESVAYKGLHRGDAGGYRVVKCFTLMMHDMRRPHNINLMSESMIPVPDEISHQN